MVVFHDKIEYLPAGDIKENPKNPRVHNAEELDRVKKDIVDTGFRGSIIVDENNVILAGHLRKDALISLGEFKVPVTRLLGLSQAQKDKILVWDNQSNFHQEFDNDILKGVLEGLKVDYNLEDIGFSIQEIEDLNKVKLYVEKEFDENIETENECPKCGYKY